MTYLLDTNICIEFLNGQSKSIRDRLFSLSPKEIVICSVVRAELFYGARKSKRAEENLKKLNEFLAPLGSSDFDDKAAEFYGVIRNQLEREGKPIGANDLLIASIAMANNQILITHNTHEFIRVAGLRLESW